MPRQLATLNNATRKMTYGDFGGLTKTRPQKSLTKSLNQSGGRDRSGRISVRHRGGGSKRLYRLVDLKNRYFSGQATVKTLEYDPNRSAFIALVELEEGQKRYILAPEGLKVGSTITYGGSQNFSLGNRLKLADIPTGYSIHNIELQPGRGGQIVRSAGTSATVTAKEGKYAFVRLPSSEVRKILLECKATIGKVSNPTHSLVRIAKAGRVRQMGRRPSVRGLAMAPNAHPHGGGEGNSSIGLKYPKTPWGKPALGFKTRRNKRTNVFIISRRKKRR